jgi:WS/DGAT/MGAT family acyltransferase
MHMERMSGLDAAFLALETPTTHMCVSVLIVLELPEGADGAQAPGAHFDRIRQVVSDRLHLVPGLRRRAVHVPFGLGHPVWAEDPGFDLDFHLRRASLPSPGGPNELAAFVADVVSRPLEPNRPLWEMHVVEGLGPGHLAVLAKLHHAMIDGISGLEVMATFLDPGPMTSAVPSPDRLAHMLRVPSGAELLAWAVPALVRQPQRALGALHTTLGAVRGLVEHNRRLRKEDVDPPPAPFRAPRTSLNGAISSRRRFAFLQVPLEEVRAVKRTFGGTVNDVVLAAVGGALRRLLAERGEQLEDSLVAMVPISLRVASPMAMSGGNGGVSAFGNGGVSALGNGGVSALGNKVTSMLVSLGTSIADPVERLGTIARGTRLAKEQARLFSEGFVEGWAQLTLPALSTRAARLAGNLRLFDYLPPLFNVTVSNVTGPTIPLWCAGAKLVAVYPAGPIAEGVGLNVTVISYMGTLYIGLVGCRELVPEVEHLALLLSDSVSELVKAARRNEEYTA